MQRMILRRYRTCLGWLGTLLVLAQLLAPGVSHALRHTDALRSALVHALLADLCSVVAPSNPGATEEAPPASTAQANACGYCLHPASQLALPTATAPDHRPALQVATVQSHREDPDRLVTAPARHRSPRAPPQPV
jgi:hypothetical protein